MFVRRLRATWIGIGMIPAICFAGLVGAGLELAMADSLAITRHDLVLCLFLGVVQYTGGFVLLALGARYPSRRRGGAPCSSEIMLAPIWVGVGVGEVPALATLVGGESCCRRWLRTRRWECARPKDDERARKRPLERSFATLPPRGTDTSAGWVTVAGRLEAEVRTPNGD